MIVVCSEMSGYNQFSSIALEKQKDLEGVFVPGEFDLWYPFIKLDSRINVGDALCRFAEGHATQDDQELFFTFFHEYLHLVQSAMYFVCQLPIIQTHNIIYDIRVTALRRKSNGERKLTPIVYSYETITVHNLIENEFESVKKEEYPILKKDFCVINILEGVVRILEEKYRGQVMEKNHWRYTAIKEINQCVLKNRALTERSLLDLCDVALGRRRSSYVFLQILEYIKGNVVASYGYKEFSKIADELGAKKMVSVSDQIITNSAKVFNSSLYIEQQLGQRLQYLRMDHVCTGPADDSSCCRALPHPGKDIDCPAWSERRDRRTSADLRSEIRRCSGGHILLPVSVGHRIHKAACQCGNTVAGRRSWSSKPDKRHHSGYFHSV